MSDLHKQIAALKHAIAEAEKVTLVAGFKPSAVAKAQQIVAQLKIDLTRLERKLADQHNRQHAA